ncbi:MAG: hypothetical protein INF43_00710 [Alphaproteobacteria bacterium]|nr:hypothetical protein [Alphaproteobacteria bacterium]
MTPSRRELFGVCLLVAGLLVLGADLWAQTNPTGTSNGQTSQMLALGLYCDGRALLTGNLGLILGLLLVFSGLWSLVTGGGWFGAIVSILIGATIPSIPGLVEGFMVGLGDLLREAKMTTRPFTPPMCSGQNVNASNRSGGTSARAAAGDYGDIYGSEWMTP